MLGTTCADMGLCNWKAVFKQSVNAIWIMLNHVFGLMRAESHHGQLYINYNIQIDTWVANFWTFKNKFWVWNISYLVIYKIAVTFLEMLTRKNSTPKECWFQRYTYMYTHVCMTIPSEDIYCFFFWGKTLLLIAKAENKEPTREDLLSL